MIVSPSSVDHYSRSPIPDPRISISGASGTLTMLVVLVALIFAWRRLSGALLSPLSPALLITSGLLMGIMVLGIRALWRRSSAREDYSHGDLILDVLLGASLLIFAAALSLRGTNAWGLGLFWLLLITEEIWTWQARARRLIARLPGKKAPFRPLRVDPAQSALPHLDAAQTAHAASEPLTSSPWPANDVTQQLVRTTAADGSEVLSGWLRLGFASGQRTGNIHVAFCPPFTRTPELTVSQFDGPQSRIKIAQLLPYGTRLDLKLVTFSAEPASVLLQFTARATGEPVGEN